MNTSDSTPPHAPRLIRISPQDNVAVATATIEPGESLALDGLTIIAAEGIPAGHKLALMPIAAGQKILKYGAPIGSAACEIHPGEHVHTHNLRSDYLPTYTLDGSNPFLRDD
ncbi:MAG TPA: UxaA family hydrolase [Thermoguttaceae bacterium]|nr:UxaA family hydrolase [Thermoguttaceae bacterium]